MQKGYYFFFLFVFLDKPNTKNDGYGESKKKGKSRC